MSFYHSIQIHQNNKNILHYIIIFLNKNNPHPIHMSVDSVFYRLSPTKATANAPGPRQFPIIGPMQFIIISASGNNSKI